jgi:AraC-like DNA-binding protein
MRSYRQLPQGPLADFVSLFWLYEGYRQPHKKERLLPDGSMELVINLLDDQTRIYDRRNTQNLEILRGSILVGAQSEYFVIDTAEQHSVIGVHFKPGGAFPFLGVPAMEVHNRLLSLEDLWGSAARELRARLLEADTPTAKFHVLENALAARIQDRTARHPAVAYALKQFHGLPHTRTIGDVTAELSLSPRRFIEVFNTEVGLTPKLFCRIRRFQRVLRSIGFGDRIEWAGVAAECGYFDQAHFIRDFRAFSGINPSTYVAHRTEHLNHVPLVD